MSTGQSGPRSAGLTGSEYVTLSLSSSYTGPGYLFLRVVDRAVAGRRHTLVDFRFAFDFPAISGGLLSDKRLSTQPREIAREHSTCHRVLSSLPRGKPMC